MDLSLLIFSLETYRFCMKCIEFTTRTYNFKNLAVGSLMIDLELKTGVNSSYFPQKNVTDKRSCSSKMAVTPSGIMAPTL